MQWSQRIKSTLTAPFRASLYGRLWMGLAFLAPLISYALKSLSHFSSFHQRLMSLIFLAEAPRPNGVGCNWEFIGGWFWALGLALVVYRSLMKKFCQMHSIRRERPTRSLQNVLLLLLLYRSMVFLLSQVLAGLDVHLWAEWVQRVDTASKLSLASFALKFIHQSVHYLPIYFGIPLLFKLWAHLDKDFFWALLGRELGARGHGEKSYRISYLTFAATLRVLMDTMLQEKLMLLLGQRSFLCDALEGLPYLIGLLGVLKAAQPVKVPVAHPHEVRLPNHVGSNLH